MDFCLHSSSHRKDLAVLARWQSYDTRAVTEITESPFGISNVIFSRLTHEKNQQQINKYLRSPNLPCRSAAVQENQKYTTLLWHQIRPVGARVLTFFASLRRENSLTVPNGTYKYLKIYHLGGVNFRTPPSSTCAKTLLQSQWNLKIFRLRRKYLKMYTTFASIPPWFSHTSGAKTPL